MQGPDNDTTQPPTLTLSATQRDAAPRLATPALSAGEVVAGRYRVARLLGRGGYGEVYEVEDTARRDHRLALKLHRLRHLSRTALDALRSEFALLATLSHPNLAAVHDFGYVESEYAFFTQTLVRGAPMARAAIDPRSEAGAHYLAQLCRALDYLHARGIVHGDVKPGNVLVDDIEERLVLLDFGVSRALGESMGSRVVGSPSYMAPELITGGQVDGRTDLYALGISLYQLVTGTVPFRGTSTQVMVAHVELEPPDLPPGVPLPLQTLIARLIAKDPEHRPQSASEVLESLARIARVDLRLDTQQTLASHVLSAPMIGRDLELDALLARCGDPSPGEPPIALVGPGGIGKSRLIRELRQRLQLQGRAWLQVQTPRSSGSLLVTLARAILGPPATREGGQLADEKLTDEERIELARALPELRRKRERIAVPLDPDRAAARRLAILGAAVARRFDAKPGVLVIEDLHWADPEDARQLGPLIAHARAAGARCVFLVASRPGPAIEHLRELEPTTLRCEELPPSASARLVASVLGDGALVDETALGAAIRETPSSALWLQESLRLAIEEGAVVREHGRFALARDVEARPLAEVLAARVALLPRDARSVALASAVLAQAASSADLCRVTGMKPSRATAALAELVSRGIVERLTQGQRRALYAMHDRYADVVLQASPPRQVRASRRRAGRWLASRDKGDFRGLGRAAAELAAAGDTARAIRALERAGALAEQAGRPEQAALLIERELALRPEGDPERTGRAARQFDLAVACGRADLADTSIARLRAAARSGEPALRVALGLREAQRALREGDAVGAQRRVDEASAIAREAGLEGLLCELYVLSGQIEYAHGTTARSRERAAEAAARARQLDRPDLEARAELQCTLVDVRHGDDASSTASAERAVAAAKRTGEPGLIADALRMLGNAHFVASRRKSALRAYRRAVKVARASGSTEAEAKALNNVAICAHAAGQVREALRAWRRAIVLKERVGATSSALLTYGSMSGVLNILGETDEARAVQERVVTSDRADARPSIALAWGNRGDTEMLSGDLDRAIDAYERGAQLYLDAGMTSLRTHALAGRTRALLVRRRPDDLRLAEELLSELERTQPEVTSREERRRYLTTRAMFLDAIGDPKGALLVARRAARLLTPDTVYEDVFGSAVEARWAVALMLARLERDAERAEAVEAARELLTRRARALDQAADVEAFLGSHPLHVAIRAGHLEPTPGCTWIRAGAAPR